MNKKKTIVFLRYSPKSRLYNQAYALKKTKKYKTILLCRDFDNKNISLLKNVFDEIICYQPLILNLKEIGFNQKITDSPIIHSFKILMTDNIFGPIFDKLSYHINFYSLFKKIKADLYNCCGSDELTFYAIKNSKKPVVMDLHNGSIMHGIENLSVERHEKDKFCFEHVSGIIQRGPKLEMEYYKNHGYKLTCPILNFLDYCNKDFFVQKDVKKLSSENDEYHLVNIGSGMQSPYIPKMLKSFFKQRIHVHIYLVPYSTVWNVYQKYFKLDKNEKYFHLHSTLPFNKIQNEIAKYDFGAIIRPNKLMERFTPEAMKIAARSYRQYNFLEAGLPIIISDRLEYFAKVVEENKIGFSVKNSDIDNLRKKINMYDYNKLSKNVMKVRENLLIDNHIKRLDKYYESLLIDN